jgi:hypothetical protein
MALTTHDVSIPNTCRDSLSENIRYLQEMELRYGPEALLIMYDTDDWWIRYKCPQTEAEELAIIAARAKKRNY